MVGADESTELWRHPYKELITLVLYFQFNKRNLPQFNEFSNLCFKTTIVDNKQMLFIKICQWLDSNRKPLLSEATALTTEPLSLSLISTPAYLFKIICAIPLQILTDALVVHGRHKWDVSGKDAPAQQDNPKAQDGQRAGNDGKPGDDGDPGESGGNVVIKFKRSEHSNNFKVVNHGGRGGPGQDGGDGVNGKNGTSGTKWTKQELDKRLPSTAVKNDETRKANLEKIHNFLATLPKKEGQPKSDSRCDIFHVTGRSNKGEEITVMSNEIKECRITKRYFFAHVQGETADFNLILLSHIDFLCT